MFDKLKGKFDGQNSLSASDGASDRRKSRDSDRKSSLSTGKSDYSPYPPEKAPSQSGPKTGYDAPPPEQPFTTNFACISLHMGDRIRLTALPQPQIDALRTTVINTWPRGIQKEREYYGSWEFKLHGYPWQPQGEDAIHARRLTRGLLATMHEGGWVLYIATDVSRKQGDKDNLFFRHQIPTPAPREWFSVTFSKGDRLRLIDAPQSIVEAALAVLQSETKSHEPYKVPGVYEIKLNGYPFAASGGDTMVSRVLCLKLFSLFEQQGYTMSASLDQKYGSEHGTETDTWIVSRPVGWSEGAPVYHQ